MQHTPILERQVQDMQQFTLFWPYYKARLFTRLQPQVGTLPEFKIDFSTITPEKPPADGKEFHQCFIHLNPERAPQERLFFKNGIGKPVVGLVFILERLADAIDRCDYKESDGRIYLRGR